MTLQWIYEPSAKWDAHKTRIVGGAPVGVFDSRYRVLREGDLIPCEWWHAEQDGRVVGFGWLDVSWGDAEILLASDVEARGHGVGTFILEHLEAEAFARGLNYLYNLVRPTHPERERVSKWLEKRGFKRSEDGRLLRAVLKRPS